MRILILLFICSILMSCGTVGGAIQGFGSDLDMVGGILQIFDLNNRYVFESTYY